MTSPSSHDLDELRTEALHRIDELAERLLGAPTERNRRELRWSPDGRYDVSLSLNKGLWFDHGSGEGGDVFDLIREALGLTFGQAVDWLRAFLNRPAQRPSSALRPDASLAERMAKAVALYRAARPGRGTLAERYFAHRGLDVPDALWRQIRFADCWFEEGRYPAVLFPLRALDNELRVVGVQRIALQADGTNARRANGKKLKKTAGRSRNAAMMLAPRNGRLCLVEGLETGLGAVMGGINRGAAVYAVPAGMLARFTPLPDTAELIIGADRDDGGQGMAAAENCARLWADAEVEIVCPKPPHGDFADMFRRP